MTETQNGLGIRGLARAADVARGTVRKYLMNPNSVSPKLRQRIAQALGQAPRVQIVDAPPKPTPSVDDLLRVGRLSSDRDEARRRERALLIELTREREAVEALASMTAAPLPPIQRHERASGLREATAIVLASDWHTEERVVETSDTAGNSYNLAIADLRVKRFFTAIESTIGDTASRFRIKHLMLWLGGDMNTGQLHEENLETGQLAPLESMLWNLDRIYAGLLMLLASDLEFDRITIPCSYGNHGRFTKKMRAATGAGHNSDWLMYQILADRFKDEPRIVFQADRAEHQYADVYGYKLHFHHGHRVNYGGGVGGITIPLNKASSQWSKVKACDFHNYGHFHQYIDTGSTAVNGSLIGFNAFGMAIKATPEPPQQSFYLIDSKRGKAMRTPLWVGDRSAELLIA